VIGDVHEQDGGQLALLFWRGVQRSQLFLQRGDGCFNDLVVDRPAQTLLRGDGLLDLFSFSSRVPARSVFVLFSSPMES
jgi:hypothetical protein